MAFAVSKLKYRQMPVFPYFTKEKELLLVTTLEGKKVIGYNS